MWSFTAVRSRMSSSAPAATGAAPLPLPPAPAPTPAPAVFELERGTSRAAGAGAGEGDGADTGAGAGPGPGAGAGDGSGAATAAEGAGACTAGAMAALAGFLPPSAAAAPPAVAVRGVRGVRGAGRPTTPLFANICEVRDKYVGPRGPPLRQVASAMHLRVLVMQESFCFGTALGSLLHHHHCGEVAIKLDNRHLHVASDTSIHTTTALCFPHLTLSNTKRRGQSRF